VFPGGISATNCRYDGKEWNLKLIVVESPAKARTIAKFLGPPYKVAASYGHIRDLPSSAKEIPSQYRQEQWARLGVDTENDFMPIYVVSAQSKQHVAALKKLLKDAEELLLATDEDREGEAISWHLLEVLKPKIPVRRITFHEITEEAIAKALSQPRDVDRQLVRAQESRRILDRLYGYSLSPVLWKKVRTKLSAGRVQSVAVRLIVEREEARQAFCTAAYWDVEAQLSTPTVAFSAVLVSIAGQRLAGGKDFDPDTGQLRPDVRSRLLDGDAAAAIAREAPAAQPWLVSKVERKQTRQRPHPPFITSTLQQAASARLGFSPRRTMAIAQRLYEGVDLGGGSRAGLITYMRTDSVTLSEKALAETAAYIKQEHGPSYTGGPRRYKTKTKSAQEAHEAIRPTDIRRSPEAVAAYLEQEELALYRLIWSRALASQMSDAILDKTTIEFTVELDEIPHIFRSRGSVVRFPGFLRVHNGGQQETLLPDLAEGQYVGEGSGRALGAVTGTAAEPAQVSAAAPTAWTGEANALRINEITPRRHETVPPPRYTEASLVKQLEEEGIGRPSTYAPIISTIQARDYALKKGGSLLPSYIGLAVVHLLRRHFPRYVDLKFTAAMEEDLDKIASGQIDWIDFLATFYQGRPEGSNGLLARIAQELPSIDYPAIPLGNDPSTGEPITVRIGRTYVYVQVGDGQDGRRATLPVDLLIDELTPEKALALIEARAKAREPIGQEPESGQNVYVLTGPYGPYVQLGEATDDQKPKRVSLPKGTRPEDVDLAHALQLLSLPRVIGTDPDSGQPIRVGLGRLGPYVERERVFVGLKDSTKLFTITRDEALALLRDKKQDRRAVLRELGPHPETGIPLKVKRGRYGPYVTDGQVNATLKEVDPEEVTREEAVALLAAAALRKQEGRKRPAKKKAKAAAGKKPTASSRKTTRKTSKKAAKKTNKKTGKQTSKTTTKKAVKKSARKTTTQAKGERDNHLDDRTSPQKS
jgi:DNA topoisomerase-1